MNKHRSKKDKQVTASQVIPQPAQKLFKVEWKALAIPALILVSTLITYWPSLQHGFIWDDTFYVEKNSLIRSFNLQEIFSRFVVGNYHPLTMLTLAAEYACFGLNPFFYHLVNLLIHLLNVVLVGYLALRLSKQMLIAYGVALLFALHPMHVESVAWISQLKDLLYTFFFLLSCLCYLQYTAHAQRTFYLLALLMFSLSLLSKAMAVSLPLVLLLIDYLQERTFTRKTIMEKIPFFILSILFGVIAIIAQQSSNAIGLKSNYHFIDRIVLAGSSFFQYLFKFLVPVRLSAFYPYPLRADHALPWLMYVYLALALFILAFTFYSIRYTRSIFFGIGFFTVTIFIVLQLLPVGDAMMADRYSYLPSFGICYMAGIGLNKLWQQQNRIILIIGCGIWLCVLSILSFIRCGIWKDGVTLWGDVISQFQHVPIAYNNRGVDYYRQKQYDLALPDFNKALQLQPDYTWAYLSRGAVYEVQHQIDQALQDYSKAIALNPRFADAYLNRGNLFKTQGRAAEAIKDYTRLMSINPDFLEAYVNRGYLYMNSGKLNEAVADFSRAIELNPDFSTAYFNRGQIFNKQNRYTAAIDDFSKVIELNPNDAEAIYFRGIAYYTTGNKISACSDIQEAARLGYQVPPQAIIEICN